MRLAIEGHIREVNKKSNGSVYVCLISDSYNSYGYLICIEMHIRKRVVFSIADS